MADQIVVIRNRRYYYFDSYDRIEEARKIALQYKKEGVKYYIMKVETGFWTPEPVYHVYLDKIQTL